MKKALLIISIILSTYLLGKSYKFAMLEQIKKQSNEGNYTKLNGFDILYYRDFLNMPLDERVNHNNAFVLLEGEIGDVHYTYYGGVRAVVDKVGCSFFNRYYENIKDYQAQEQNISAICVLPYFNKCVPVMEGIDNFYN